MSTMSLLRTRRRAKLTSLGREILLMLHTLVDAGGRPWCSPHVHCVVPGGGFSLDGRRWARVRKVSFLVAVKALSRRFRTLFCKAVRAARLQTASPSTPAHSRSSTLSSMPQRHNASHGASRSSMRQDLVRHLMNSTTRSAFVVPASSPLPWEWSACSPKTTVQTGLSRPDAVLLSLCCHRQRDLAPPATRSNLTSRWLRTTTHPSPPHTFPKRPAASFN
jgi:hypothetical protein